MSTEATEPIVWPSDAEQLGPIDHIIVASNALSDAVEHYWNQMGARPSLGDFQLSVAELHREVQRDEYGAEDVDDVDDSIVTHVHFNKLTSEEQDFLIYAMNDAREAVQSRWMDEFGYPARFAVERAVVEQYLGQLHQFVIAEASD